MDELYDELLVELECPICTHYMSPPIRQCSTGHSICNLCRKKLPKCPLCQGGFTESKNISLEALARKMHYPCINKASGCTAKLAFDERDEHEKICTYKGFKCGMEKCPWTGKLDEVKSHWESKKMTSKPYKASNVCHTKLKSDSYYVNMVEAHDSLFWFKCKSVKGQIFWAVQYIGDTTNANKYYYEIELFKPGQPKRRTLHGDYCHPVDIDNTDLFKEDICMFTTTDAIGRYVGDDQLLIYYMRVLQSHGGNQQEESEEGGSKKSSKKGHHNKNREHSQGPMGKEDKSDEKHKFKKNPNYKKKEQND